jgi:hypothetical protein
MSKTDSIEFIGIGMVKCGTSWISRCLAAHPQILFSGRKSSKEIKFFNKAYNLNKGINWYLKQFPRRQEGKIRGEFTPAYMVDENANNLIHRFFPNVKLLVSLRNPPDMLYSLYRDWSATPWVEIADDFDKAVRNKEYDKIRIEYGLYYKNLKKYYDLFPKENILVLLFEDINQNREQTLERLYKFLGVDEKFRSPALYERVNQTVVPRSMTIHKLTRFFITLTRETKLIKAIAHSPIMNEIIYHGYKKINGKKVSRPVLFGQTRQTLSDFFHADIEKLEKLIGRDLSSWKQHSAVAAD